MEYWDDIEEPDYLARYPRDAAIDHAITRLRAFFKEFPKTVFYSTQIETVLEREFFHWIIGKALLEMAELREIQKMTLPVGSQNVNFYANRKYRYTRREVKTK